MNNNNGKLAFNCYAFIKNKRGLHARASAKFVEIVDQFDAKLTVKKGSLEVSGDSIMGLLTLSASQGTEIELTAEGNEAESLIKALQKLIDEKFGETE